MIPFSKEYFDKTFKRATWWDTHPDRCPNDYGPPQRREDEQRVVLTEQEREEYEEWLSNIQEDEINQIPF